MSEICSDRVFWSLAFFASINQFFVSAYSDDLSSSNNETKAEHPRGSKGSKIVIISLLLVAAALVLFLLFKFWQRKKREEQYARLLKLFEEDDELELELGLRD
ncbi:transmembrane protein [Salvia divinorum]|uniref:Transmembrane protein n=1 Tax=Salvia divinorum TaxID=28513 RepID=A0ABD1IAY8_SALDI